MEKPWAPLKTSNNDLPKYTYKYQIYINSNNGYTYIAKNVNNVYNYVALVEKFY
jgi:hypothetical protein